MIFGSPAFLWMLAALVPLAAAYFLKVRPRRFPVNALFLWEKIFQEKKASSLFQRLRDLLSLLLMALALAAIAFAAAGPRPAKQDRRDLLLVIDTSPSMRAKTGGKEGIELARERARDIVRALNGTRRGAVASASGTLDFLSHASDSPKDLTEAIARLKAAETPVSLETVSALNACARGAGAAGRVLLITDGNAGWEGLDPAVEVMRVGTLAPNAGFVAADLDRKPGSTRGAVFFYRIASSVKQETSAELELRHDDGGGLARLVPVTLKPGEEISDTLEIEDAPAGRWTAELKFPDALPTDNVVALGLAEPKPITVKVATAQPYFFRRCIEAFSLTGGLLAPAEDAADLTIAQGSPALDSRQIIFAPAGESPFWTDSGAGDIEVLAAEAKVPGHPVTKHLELETMRFEGARDLTPAAGSLVLATAENGKALIWKARADGREAVVVNLDPARGEFFFSPVFPALVHGAALDLTGRHGSLRSAHPTGSLLDAGGPVTTPAGAHLPAGDFLVENLGHYRAETPAGARWFGGALFERAETVLDGSGPADSGVAIERGYPPAFWLLFVALLLLLVEFFLYHRRKAG